MEAIDLQMFGRLLLASVLGAVIGLEREVRGRSAGFRTHLLVSLGSCLFVIISIDFHYMFGNFTGSGPIGADPARIAAQVVTGIGFLGAGAIVREKAFIRGLTTAACLWVASAIGMACGAGRFASALVVTLFAFTSLLLLKKVESRLKRDIYMTIKVWSTDLDGQVARVEQAMTACQLQVLSMAMEKNLEQQTLALHFQVKRHSSDASSKVVDEISRLTGITRIWVE